MRSTVASLGILLNKEVLNGEDFFRRRNRTFGVLAFSGVEYMSSILQEKRHQQRQVKKTNDIFWQQSVLHTTYPSGHPPLWKPDRNRSSCHHAEILVLQDRFPPWTLVCVA
mmetsp:Transcript_17470/g.36279  ORF Transcript_17470/g.36279 Transcript_17470/m.36279 type:complete len:111 (+) Transcript_17470:569-901(+)